MSYAIKQSLRELAFAPEIRVIGPLVTVEAERTPARIIAWGVVGVGVLALFLRR
jgi:hypothetical protein